MSIPELPDPAIAELRKGRTVEAIRLVREARGIGLKEAKEAVEAAMARDPSLRVSTRSPVATALIDFLAGSWKFPFAAGMGAGAFSLWGIGEFAPHLLKAYDPGLLMLAALGIPLVVVSGSLMLWARRWRAARAAEAGAALAAAAAPPTPARPRFGGLPDPGGPMPGDALPAAAMAALDRDDPIAAIKALRAERGLGLAEAKALVDAERARRKRGGR